MGLWDHVDEKVSREALKVLTIAEAKKRGTLPPSFPYWIDLGILDLVIDELAWLVIHLESKGKHKKTPPLPLEPLHEVVKIAGKEAEEIYQEAVKPVGFDSYNPISDADRMEKAIQYLREHQDRFEAVKPEHLLNIDLDTESPFLQPGQERRGFIGRVLQAVIDDCFQDYPVKTSYQKLYQAYKRLLNS